MFGELNEGGGSGVTARLDAHEVGRSSSRPCKILRLAFDNIGGGVDGELRTGSGDERGDKGCGEEHGGG